MDSPYFRSEDLMKRLTRSARTITSMMLFAVFCEYRERVLKSTDANPFGYILTCNSCAPNSQLALSRFVLSSDSLPPRGFQIRNQVRFCFWSTATVLSLPGWAKAGIPGRHFG